MAFLGQFRGDLRSEWEAKNPVIHDREFILVKEDPDGPWTGYKIGDGGKRFNELDYASNISLLQILGNSEVAAVSQKVTTSVSKDLARAISIKWWNKGSDLPYNGYIHENGSLVPLSGIFSTDFIEVSTGVDIQVVNAFIVDKAVIAIYSTSKTFTRYLKDMDDNGNVTFSLNEGEKYIRFSSMSKTEGVGVRFININIVGINERISDVEDEIISTNEQDVEPSKDFINIVSAFDNLICVGDSLTYSQVYTSTTGSRQAYVSYPKALARLCGNEQTTLARSGATAKQCWDEFGSQIVQKRNSLAIIYLGTNAGISDTLSTDVVGDDPDAWADNNLGCYCRIVQKLQSLGTKILLLKIWASSGTGDSSLANTKNAITHIGERFNCAVMDVPLNRELKYHYYPDLSGSNGVHYNDLGYAWFASSLIQKIGELDESQMKLLIPS